MKKSYCQQVRNWLLLPREMAATVQADLEEIFAEAAAQGESETQVIARLGPPRQFATAMNESLGAAAFAAARPQRLRRAVVLIALFLAAVALQLLLTPFGAMAEPLPTYANLPLALFRRCTAPLTCGLGEAALLSALAVGLDLRLRRRDLRWLLTGLGAALLLLCLAANTGLQVAFIKRAIYTQGQYFAVSCLTFLATYLPEALLFFGCNR